MTALKDFIFINLVGYEIALAVISFYNLYLFFEPLGLLGIIPAMPAFVAALAVTLTIISFTSTLFFPERTTDP